VAVQENSGHITLQEIAFYLNCLVTFPVIRGGVLTIPTEHILNWNLVVVVKTTRKALREFFLIA